MIERVLQTLITTGEGSRAIRRVTKVNAFHRSSQLQTMPKPMQVQDGTCTVSLACHGKKTASRVRHNNGHSECICTHSSVATAAVDVRCFLSHYGCTQSSQPLWMYTVFYSNSHYGCTQFSQPQRMYTVFSATVDVHSLPSHKGCTQSSQPLWMYTVFPATMDVHSFLSHKGCTQSSQPLWMYTVFSATKDVHSLLSHYGCTQSSQPQRMYTVFPATMGVHSLLSHCECTQSSTAIATVDAVFSTTVDFSYCGCTQSSQPLWMYTVFSATVDVHSLLSHSTCTQSSVATVIVDEHCFQSLR